MSKIMQGLMKATGIKEERGESKQEFLARLVHAVHGLDDKAWEGLNEAEQDWFNNAADAKNAKKDIPDFPDAEAPAASSRRRPAAEPEAETTSRRRSSEPEVYEPKVGDMVAIKTKRGAEAKGKVVEVAKDIIAIDDGKEEVEFNLDRVESVLLDTPPAASGRRQAAADEPAKAKDPVVGDVVTVTTKRGVTFEGKLLELDAKGGCLVDKDGKEQEFDFDRVEKFALAGGAAEAPAASGRRSRGAPAADDKKDGEKNTKISRADNKGVSATMRMRELILDDMSAKEDDVAKVLKKEGLQFKDNTLQLVYSDVHRLLKMMRERKLIK